MFPTITKMAWARNKKDIQTAHPEMTRRKYAYRVHLESYDGEFGYEDDKPGFLLTALSHAMRVLPKVGPLRKYKISLPGPDAEALFVKSFDTVTGHYTMAIHNLQNGLPCFHNMNYDTGDDTHPGEYGLADKNYSRLLVKLHKRRFANTSPALRRNIVTYFNGMTGKPRSVTDHVWNKTVSALNDLKKIEQGTLGTL
jgi:hypothetical protein